jgi:hypothetical protein
MTHFFKKVTDFFSSDNKSYSILVINNHKCNHDRQIGMITNSDHFVELTDENVSISFKVKFWLPPPPLQAGQYIKKMMYVTFDT